MTADWRANGPWLMWTTADKGILGRCKMEWNDISEAWVSTEPVPANATRIFIGQFDVPLGAGYLRFSPGLEFSG